MCTSALGSVLLAKLSASDLISQEAVYHLYKVLGRSHCTAKLETILTTLKTEMKRFFSRHFSRIVS